MAQSSRIAAPGSRGLLSAFWGSSIGMKILMALSGVVLFGFVIGHLLGNLQIYVPDGGKRLNEYAQFLRNSPGLLWTTRIVLLVSVVLHIVTAIRLWKMNSDARPEPYVFRRYRRASYAARTMMWSGPIIALFVLYHLLHFTTGDAHQDFRPEDVHHNVVAGFGVWWVSALYIAAQIALGFHLWHGAWSMFQSVGVNHPTCTPLLKKFAIAMAVLITAGNISIPLAVLAKWVR